MLRCAGRAADGTAPCVAKRNVDDAALAENRRFLTPRQYAAFRKRVDSLNNSVRRHVVRRDAGHEAAPAAAATAATATGATGDRRAEPPTSRKGYRSNSGEARLVLARLRAHRAACPFGASVRSALTAGCDAQQLLETSGAQVDQASGGGEPRGSDSAMKSLEELQREAAGGPPVTLWQLTSEELKLARKYAWIELTALMDHYIGRIPQREPRRRSAAPRVNFRPFKSSPSKSKVALPVFGVSLDQLCEAAGMQVASEDGLAAVSHGDGNGSGSNGSRQAQQPAQASPPAHALAPPFLRTIIGFLDNSVATEGLFRKVGSAARVRELRELCDQTGGQVDLAKLEARPHDVATLLKQFLRDLPQPLLTEKYSDIFAATQGLPDVPAQVNALQLLMLLVPDTHVGVLRLLLEFLARVADCAEQNKMSASNLSMIFAPNLFFAKDTTKSKEQQEREREIQATTAACVKVMIEQHRDLWTVPADIVAQVRYHQAHGDQKRRKSSKPKELLRLPSSPALTPSPSGVPVPLSSNSSVASSAASSLAQVPPPPPPPKRTEWLDQREGNMRAIIRVACAFSPDRSSKAVLVSDPTRARETISKAIKHLANAPALDDCALYITSGTGSRRLPDDELILPLVRRNPEAVFHVDLAKRTSQ